MLDMGKPFHNCRSRFLDVKVLATEFHTLMQRVIQCQEKSHLVHGDIHIGNLVCDGQTLHLIDYDEALSFEATKRQPRTPDQRRVYTQSLANDVDKFTKNQLINLFRDCCLAMGHYRTSDAVTSEMEEDDEAVEEGGKPRADLVEAISRLMKEYEEAFKEGKSPGAGLVDGIYQRLDAILSGATSRT
jgi:hypothetical protein